MISYVFSKKKKNPHGCPTALTKSKKKKKKPIRNDRKTAAPNKSIRHRTAPSPRYIGDGISRPQVKITSIYRDRCGFPPPRRGPFRHRPQNPPPNPIESNRILPRHVGRSTEIFPKNTLPRRFDGGMIRDRCRRIRPLPDSADRSQRYRPLIGTPGG